jgi:hypothetical protein
MGTVCRVPCWWQLVSCHDMGVGSWAASAVGASTAILVSLSYERGVLVP